MRNRRFAIIAFSLSVFLLLFVSPAYGAEKVIRLLYLNDFHGFAEPHTPLGSSVPLGGIASLAARAEELRKEEPSLLLSAGDMIQGNTWADLFEGRPVIEVMNAMHFDAMVVGNHEFDFGLGTLKKRISEADFPILGANVTGFPSLKPYVVKEIAGLRVAIIGVVTSETPVTTHPGNVVGLRFDSPADIVNKYIAELKDRADIVVVLSHIGFSEDRTLARDVKGINVVVGGHSHTKLMSPAVVGNTIIVQAWEHAKAFGVLDLRVENRKIVRFEGRLEEIRPEPGKEDQAVLRIVKKYEQQVDSLLDKKIGETDVDLDGENVRRRETNLGDFLADVIRQESGAEAAIVNGGDIRTSIKRGEIRMKDIHAALPFNDYIVAVRLTGNQIREALEHGVSALPEEDSGRFPQVSGLSFSYNPNERQGSKVKEILIEGRPLIADKIYSVGTNDFLAAGGDGYRVFGEAIGKSKEIAMTEGIAKGGAVVYSDPGRWLKDIVTDYISKKKIAPKVEGRIREIRESGPTEQ